jgi:ABC-type lipoprotein release transport system permease subunit
MFVFGYEIHVYSDHNPLTYLTASAPNSARPLRWSLALQRFNIQFHNKAGKSAAMAIPDCLTRFRPSDDGDGSAAKLDLSRLPVVLFWYTVVFVLVISCVYSLVS